MFRSGLPWPGLQPIGRPTSGLARWEHWWQEGFPELQLCRIKPSHYCDCLEQKNIGSSNVFKNVLEEGRSAGKFPALTEWMDSLKVIFSSLILHRMCFLTHILDQQENPIAVLAVLFIYLQAARGKGGGGERDSAEKN